MYEKIKELCKRKGITVQQAEKEMGFGNGTLSGMSPKSQVAKVKIISDYFNVSMSYLMDWEEDLTVNSDNGSQFLIEIEKIGLSEQNQKMLLQYAEFLKSKENI